MANRSLAVSGLFYPERSSSLQKMVESYISEAQKGLNPSLKNVKAIVSPHAGYIYSGSCAGYAFACPTFTPKRIFLFGPTHHVYFSGLSVGDFDFLDCPLGQVKVNRNLVEKALNYEFIDFIASAHGPEHCLEVMFPFIKQKFPEAEVATFLCGQNSSACVEKVLTDLYKEETDLILISTDLSHFNSYDEANSIDRETISMVETMQSQSLSGDRACGYQGLSGLIGFAKKNQWKVNTLKYQNSGDTAGDKSRVVGYVSFAFTAES